MQQRMHGREEGKVGGRDDVRRAETQEQTLKERKERNRRRKLTRRNIRDVKMRAVCEETQTA